MELVQKYKLLILRLLPSGKAWNKEIDSELNALAEGIGVEGGRIQTRGEDLLRELDPRTTYELLEDWEKEVGLPDECEDIAGTIPERIAAVVRRYTMRGGNTMNAKAFIELAAYLGYTITINKPSQNLFRCGRSRCGDRLYGANWKFWFEVITEDTILQVFRTGQNRCGDRLRNFQNTVLECLINKAKPSHTKVRFIYMGVK